MAGPKCETCDDRGYVYDVGPDGEPAGDDCPDCSGKTTDLTKMADDKRRMSREERDGDEPASGSTLWRYYAKRLRDHADWADEKITALEECLAVSMAKNERTCCLWCGWETGRTEGWEERVRQHLAACDESPTADGWRLVSSLLEALEFPFKPSETPVEDAVEFAVNHMAKVAALEAEAAALRKALDWAHIRMLSESALTEDRSDACIASAKKALDSTTAGADLLARFNLATAALNDYKEQRDVAEVTLNEILDALGFSDRDLAPGEDPPDPIEFSKAIANQAATETDRAIDLERELTRLRKIEDAALRVCLDPLSARERDSVTELRDVVSKHAKEERS